LIFATNFFFKRMQLDVIFLLLPSIIELLLIWILKRLSKVYMDQNQSCLKSRFKFLFHFDLCILIKLVKEMLENNSWWRLDRSYLCKVTCWKSWLIFSGLNFFEFINKPPLEMICLRKSTYSWKNMHFSILAYDTTSCNFCNTNITQSLYFLVFLEYIKTSLK